MLRAHPRESRGLALVGAALASAALFVVDPSRSSVVLCPLRATTGYDCPFCGSTRAAHELLHGNVVEAIDFNLLFVMSLPVAGVMLVSSRVRSRLPRWTLWAALGVAIVFAVVRNIPGSWLGS